MKEGEILHSNETVLQAIQLTKVYGSGEAEIAAVDRLTFSIQQGSLWQLLDHLEAENPPYCI